MAQEKTKLRFWSGQLDLNPIEMLWHDLKQLFHARKPFNVTKLKQFCKEEVAKIPPQQCERLITSYQMLDCSCCCKGWHKQFLDLVANYFFT